MDETQSKALEARVTELEMLFTHLQRTVQDLNEVVLDQKGQIERLEDRLDRVTVALETLSHQRTEHRSIEEERPPHY